MTSHAIIIGSGAGGSVAAMVLAAAGLDVTILEKGQRFFDNLGDPAPATRFSSDELKTLRAFARADPDAEPRTYRTSATDTNVYVGEVQSLPQTVGGGTTHWDAKTPRFWDIDFKKRSLLGPVDGADVEDWPFDYAELAPRYDEIERLIGVAGDVAALPAHPTLAHAPRSKPLPMPPGPAMYSSLLAAKGATAIGLNPFLVPMAINSVPYDGRPACNNCGLCSGYGCPIVARVGALAPLRQALELGAELRTGALVVGIPTAGRRASGVTWVDDAGARHTEAADIVVLAANAIESSRLAQLAGLPDPFDQAGRHVMFHWFTDGSGIFLDERPHPARGRAITHDLDDFADPDFPGARAAAAAAGLPYFRAGTVEMGGSQSPISEAKVYQQLLRVVAPHHPFGVEFKRLMRASLLRERIVGMSLIGEDLPYATNRVDLDPRVRDWRGVPVARITYGPGAHELTAQAFYMPWLIKVLTAAGAGVATAVPSLSSAKFAIAADAAPSTMHVMGGMRMGDHPRTSVTDGAGRHHQLDNVFVADGGLFPSSGGHNPTLTIMATVLRNARRWVS